MQLKAGIHIGWMRFLRILHLAIKMHCDWGLVSWLQESTSYGGHSIPTGGHRKVSGIVRARVKEEIRKEIDDELQI